MNLAPLYLKSREFKRLLTGHLWIYSNEIDTKKSPLKSFEPGQTVNIIGNDGKALATAYINPHSLIAARIISYKPNVTLDQGWFKTKLQQAQALRTMFFDKPFYRLCFSEGDYIPGLIIDRFDDAFVLQINTAGIEKVTDSLVDALEDLYSPGQIILRNDSSSRLLEGLQQAVEIVKGDSEQLVFVEENDSRFQVDALRGQKTGWFYDQRNNRSNLLPLAKGKTVLDVFSYTGGWSVSLAKSGCDHVTAIDVSQAAIDTLKQNASLNGVSARIDTICEDAFRAKHHPA